MGNWFSTDRILLNLFALVMIAGCIWGMQYVWKIVQTVMALINAGIPA